MPATAESKTKAASTPSGPIVIKGGVREFPSTKAQNQFAERLYKAKDARAAAVIEKGGTPDGLPGDGPVVWEARLLLPSEAVELGKKYTGRAEKYDKSVESMRFYAPDHPHEAAEAYLLLLGIRDTAGKVELTRLG